MGAGNEGHEGRRGALTHAETHAILDAQTAQAAASAIARTLLDASGACAAYVALTEPASVHDERDVLRIAAIEGEVHRVRALGAELGDGAERAAIGRTEPAWVRDAVQLEGRAARDVQRLDAMVVALGAHGVAVILFSATGPAPSDDAALRLASTIAAMGRVAIDHAAAIDEGRHLNARLQAVLALQRTLASGLLDDVFGVFATRLAEELPFDLAYVGSLVPGVTQGEAIEIVTAHPAEDPILRAGARLLADTPIAQILRSMQARSAGPTFVDRERARSLAPWAASAIVVPLVMHDAVVGVLVLLSRTSHATVRADARWLLGALAEPLAMALQNAELFARLRTTMREWERTFDVMDAMVFIADEHARVRRANWALARRLASTPATLVGRPITALFPNQVLPVPSQTPRVSITGPRGEALRASAVPLPEGGMVVVLHDLAPLSTQQSPSYAALRRVSTGSILPRRGRVLIVDDEPSIVRAVSRTLGRHHDVVTATDGDEALEVLRAPDASFDAVITDVQMARIGGIDLYRAIERERPELVERFLFMTGGVFASDIEQFLRALGPRVLRKPFDPEILRRAIDERVALRVA